MFDKGKNKIFYNFLYKKTTIDIDHFIKKINVFKFALTGDPSVFLMQTIVKIPRRKNNNLLFKFPYCVDNHA